MKHSYKTHGVCSQRIDFELEEGVIRNVVFYGGCNGNLKAIAKLTEGQKAEDIIAILAGNTCGMKNTSCADQFSIALRQALDEENA